MRTSLLIAAVGISVSLLVAACGKKNDASESSLGEAISADMKTNRGLLCLNRSGRGPYVFPSAYTDRDLNEYSAAALREQLAALEKAGLIARAAPTTANANAKQNGIAYSLTGNGQKYAVETTRQPGDPNATADSRVWMLCYAHVKLDKVAAWTEPDPTAHRSDVTYTYKLEDVASWMDDRDIKRAFPEVTAADRESGETKLHVTLEQRPDGWARVD
jgi:hypothetical protein